MGLFDDLAFHFKNYVSYKTRDNFIGSAMRRHLENELRENDRISEGTKRKVAKDLFREDVRQTVRHVKK